MTVVVPCYNYGRYLAACVESVMSQTGCRVDVLIIDDASPDGSGDIADALAATEERISVIRHTENRGHIATFNEGLALVESEYVILISADDLLTPGSLPRALALLEANPHVGLVYGHPVAFVDQVPSVRTRVRNWQIWSGEDWIERRCRAGTNCIRCPEVVMRTSTLREIGYFRSDLPHSGDMEMWMRAATAGHIGRVNGADQGLYRVHPESMMHTRFASYLADLEGRRDAFDALFAGRGASLPGAVHMHERARRKLALDALRWGCRVYDNRTAPEEPVQAYVDFARSVYPQAGHLPVAHALARRQELGPDRVPAMKRYRARHAIRGIEDRVRSRTCDWRGV